VSGTLTAAPLLFADSQSILQVCKFRTCSAALRSSGLWSRSVLFRKRGPRW